MQRNSNRIVIPRHVLDEYMSKRMYVIEKIPQDVANKRERLENVAAKLEKPHAIFEDKINSELHERGFLHEAPNVKDILRQILDNLKNRLQVDEEYNKLIERLRESIRINNDDLRIVTHKADPILSAICKAVLLESLSEKEKLFLDKLYDNLCERNKKSSSTVDSFPGFKDKDKDDNLYGDFYIYHEMMSYIADNKKDCVFLTKDVTKGDWVRKDRKPHIQYIIDMFAHTGHILHIVDANKLNVGMNPINNTNAGEACLNKSISEENAIDNETTALEIVTSSAEDAISPISNEESKPQFKSISESRFLSELENTLKWADNYGNGLVSENFFIHDILAPKRFNIRSCYMVKDDLLRQDKIKIEPVEKDGRHFNSISFP